MDRKQEQFAIKDCNLAARRDCSLTMESEAVARARSTWHGLRSEHSVHVESAAEVSERAPRFRQAIWKA